MSSLPEVPRPSLSVAPRTFPTGGFHTIPGDEVVEEEEWAWYTPHSFYPVRIGEVLSSRYQILYKLGYGTTGTVWMGRDLSVNKYVCLKSMVCDYGSVQREIGAYKILAHAFTKSRAPRNVRHALDHFTISHAGREYNFLVHEPLGVSEALFFAITEGVVQYPMSRGVIHHMLHALHYLHTEAKIVHGDIKSSNILLTIHDPTVLVDEEEEEFENPSARKMTVETAIFESHDFSLPLSRWIGDNSVPILCDFGEARYGEAVYTGVVQPACYRAPEVFFDIPWSTPVDIWNLGCMTWHLAFKSQLFPRPSDGDQEIGDIDQIAKMISLLGPPPPTLLARNMARTAVFFNEDGSPRGKAPPGYTFEALFDLESEKMGMAGKFPEREKAELFRFMRRALTWTAESRATAAELLSEPWTALTM